MNKNEKKSILTLKDIVYEDWINYKKPSMFLLFPNCSWKCGFDYCQNSPLAKQANIKISMDTLIQRFIDNPITNSFVFGGLEPFDSMEELVYLMAKIRLDYNLTNDIVIYTGYTQEEIEKHVHEIIRLGGVFIVKYGRYLSGHEPHFDEVLGVNLVSDNQYAVIYNS